MRRNQFIEQERRYKRAMTEMVPRIYAAFAISLHRNYGFGFVRIGRILADTQRYWQTMSSEEINALCIEETGINMVSETTAKAAGIKEGRKI